MIHYDLTCDKNHRFDGWFQSAAAYDRSRAAGMVTCSVCGSTVVEKALMAPSVAKSEGPARPLSAPANPMEEALAALRRKVETESDYVGLSFAAEARAMHEGTAPERAIWGEARPEEARALIEDGVPVAPLPFMNRNRAN